MKEITQEDIEKRLTCFTSEDWDKIGFMAELVGALLSGRERKGLTQKELGEQSGLAQNYVARIENFRTEPKLSTAIKLLKPLGLTLAVVPISSLTEKSQTDADNIQDSSLEPCIESECVVSGWKDSVADQEYSVEFVGCR